MEICARVGQVTDFLLELRIASCIVERAAQPIYCAQEFVDRAEKPVRQPMA